MPDHDVAKEEKEDRLIDEAVSAFIKKTSSSFTYDDICNAIYPMFFAMNISGFNERVEYSVRRSELVVPIERSEENPAIIPWTVFYKGAEFCVVPSKEEIDSGILIPGIRFHPYISVNIDGKDVQIFPEEFPGEFKKTNANVSLYCLGRACYACSGMSDMILNREEFRGKNSKDVGMDKDICLVDVFDLKDYYSQISMKPGDALFFTVEDHSAGKLKVRRVNSAELLGNVDSLKTWMQKFVSNIIDGIDRYDADLEIPMQFEDAFLQSPELLGNPPLDIFDILTLSSGLELKRIDGLTVIWEKGRKLPAYLKKSRALKNK